MKRKLLLNFSLILITLTVFANPTKNNQRTFRISKNLSIFNSLFRELDLFYVDTLSYDKIIQTAIGGMLSKLDPYTVYIPEEETDDLKFMTTGEYAGIGALIMKNGKEICISEPYESMPAQRADVKAGDVILEIDGKSTDGLTVSQVSNRLKGVPNTIIKLKLKRFGEKKPIEKEFKREKIQVNPVTYNSLVANKIGFVQLSEFTDKSANEIKNIISDMQKHHQIESIIIDLRNNGGGLIDEAVKIAGYFVPKGTEIVTTKGNNTSDKRVYKTPLEPLFPKMNVIILTNRSSASASEILAGAFQDLDRGLLVGERTFGKGLVQNIRPIDYGGHLKVTTAKYYIPSGRCIQAIDYSHRNDDGSVGRVPDSLTTEFKTLNGRNVRDGGGIVPDTLTKDERKLSIAYYIFAQNHYFNFANQFAANHTSVDKPSEFKLTDTDFNLFTNYLIDKKFSYTSQTEKYFTELLEIAKYEGLDKDAKIEFESLKSKLVPDILKNINDNKEEISELLSLEIIKRYYFQKGEIEYALKTDKDLKLAIELLQNTELYNKILTKK